MADNREQGPIVEATAGAGLTAYRAIAVLEGEAIHADKDTATHAGKVRGILTQGAVEDATARIQVFGPIVNPAWNWTPDLPIYVSNDGALTQTVPATGFVQAIAWADSATRIFIDPDTPIDREQRLSLPFAYGDATPATIGVIPSGTLVKSIDLHITTAFDGASPSLRVGRSGALDELMLAAHNDPASLGTYETNPNQRYGSDTTLLLSITPGAGASAGAGLLVVNYHL